MVISQHRLEREVFLQALVGLGVFSVVLALEPVLVSFCYCDKNAGGKWDERSV